MILCSCASSTATFVRTDGRPVDSVQERAALAQCKGEAATTETSRIAGGLAGVLVGASDRNTVTDACMARAGYIKPQ